MHTPFAFLCISTYYKGSEFLRACKEAGNTVYFITEKKLEHKPWPREYIDEFFMIESGENTPQNHEKLILGVAYLMRSRKIDCIVALDDFDVEKAAILRETFRIPGMGFTTAQYFRDKLAMRMRAANAGINVPPFQSLFHDLSITEYLQTTQAPWLIKPRSEASATGIKKVHSLEEAWQVIHSLGDNRYRFLIEQFKPGDVFHVDSISLHGKAIFQRSSRYLAPPIEVSHEGGIFRSMTLDFNSKEDKALKKMNQEVLKAFGMQSCTSHSEFIKCKEDGKFYFLETSARVGGAHLVEMIEASSGINLWREWAKLETALLKGEEYVLPPITNKYSGIIMSLSRFQHTDTSQFQDPEIYWRANLEYHIGFIFQSEKKERIMELLDTYAHIIREQYHASAPVPEKPTH
ncbi:MAG: ATPase [Microscillaceae bacterium]|nr:ATPase [Microscillaceae bacterium]MDW8460212.1 ATPase [Cytophagales bacterium]